MLRFECVDLHLLDSEIYEPGRLRLILLVRPSELPADLKGK